MDFVHRHIGAQWIAGRSVTHNRNLVWPYQQFSMWWTQHLNVRVAFSRTHSNIKWDGRKIGPQPIWYIYSYEYEEYDGWFIKIVIGQVITIITLFFGFVVVYTHVLCPWLVWNARGCAHKPFIRTIGQIRHHQCMHNVINDIKYHYNNVLYIPLLLRSCIRWIGIDTFACTSSSDDKFQCSESASDYLYLH